MTSALYESELHSLPLIQRGKVRDIYAVDDEHMLIVTTDRLSAFDVILPTPIPGKGEVLTQVSNFWFDRMKHVIPNHLSALKLEDVIPDAAERAPLEKRSIIVRRLRPLPIEAIVRGYLIGSGWKDYQQTGAVCGIPLPAGLQLADQLPDQAVRQRLLCSRPPGRHRNPASGLHQGPNLAQEPRLPNPGRTHGHRRAPRACLHLPDPIPNPVQQRVPAHQRRLVRARVRSAQ